MSHRRSRSSRLFRALLRLLPGEFRGDFGDEITADFEDRRREMRSTAALWRRELPALLATVIREHAGVLWRDVRYALRLMRRTPGFTALAITMLALGTGANVAVFSVVDGVMLRSPFPDPERLAIVRVTDAEGRFTASVPRERYLQLAASPGPFAAVAAIGFGDHVLTGSGDPRRLDFACVSPSMFEVLGTRPLIGRTLQPADDRPGAAPTLVLSYQFWRQLGGRADVVGSTVRLNQAPVTIVGVMPPGFAGPYSRSDEHGWLPVSVTVSGGGLTGCRHGASANVFARVRGDLTLVEAQAALPDVQLVSLQDATFEDLRTPFLALSAAVVCVLLIACLNVGGLQLERTLARRREMGVRLALGASRGRLVRQTLTESLVLGLAGAVAGVLVALLTQGFLISLLPSTVPHLDQIEVNGRALGAGFLAAAFAGIVAGVIPGLQSRQFRPVTDLAAAARTATRRADWARRALATTQIGLSIVTLIGAGLMIQTFLTLRPAHPGFDPARKVTTLVRLPGATAEQSADFFGRLFERAAAIPALRRVGGSSYLPLASTIARIPVTYQDASTNVSAAIVTRDYFDLMTIPLIAGRPFAESDVAGAAPVAIVNEIFARQLRSDGAVVGQRVRARAPRRPGAAELDWTIVGVIANTRAHGADTRPRAEFYVPFAQHAISTLYLIAETEPGQEAMVAAEIRRALRETDPTIVIEPVELLIDQLYSRVDTWRLGAWLLGIFAALAVMLAAAGLMTTIGWWVSQRTREMGVRVALGASRGQVSGLVLRQGLSMAGVGIAIGCLAASWLTRYLESWIYGVSALDPRTFAGAAAAMFVVAAGAIALPVRRALSVDPVIALKVE